MLFGTNAIGSPKGKSYPVRLPSISSQKTTWEELSVTLSISEPKWSSGDNVFSFIVMTRKGSWLNKPRPPTPSASRVSGRLKSPML